MKIEDVNLDIIQELLNSLPKGIGLEITSIDLTKDYKLNLTSSFNNFEIERKKLQQEEWLQSEKKFNTDVDNWLNSNEYFIFMQLERKRLEQPTKYERLKIKKQQDKILERYQNKKSN